MLEGESLAIDRPFAENVQKTMKQYDEGLIGPKERKLRLIELATEFLNVSLSGE